MDEKQLERQRIRVRAEMSRAADILAQSFSDDTRETIGGAMGSLADATVYGTYQDCVAALRCVGQTLIALADREMVFEFNKEKRHRLHDLRMGRGPSVRRRPDASNYRDEAENQ